MGLDMYLTGEAFYCYGHDNRQAKPFPIKESHLDLGYWRKHPNLHGYIVNTFGGGQDECQKIDLTKDDMLNLIEAVQEERLPHTEGFFFGASAVDPEMFVAKYGCTLEEAQAEKLKEKERDLLLLKTALAWLETEEKDVWKSISYRASW